MTSLVPAAPRLVLADRLVSRTLTTDVVLVAAGAALTAILAQVSIPMFPVPITGQTLAVLLVGATLGAVRGASSLALYAVLGLVGLPVYAPQADGSHLTGFLALAAPSFGYIVGFVFAAAIVGSLSERTWDRKFFKALATFVGGSVVVFAFGLPWLEPRPDARVGPVPVHHRRTHQGRDRRGAAAGCLVGRRQARRASRAGRRVALRQRERAPE